MTVVIGGGKLQCMETFAERLQRLRETKGLSSREFARRVGKSSGYLSLVENGLRIADGNLKARDAQIWAEVLGVTPDELLGLDEASQQRPHRLTEADLYARFGIKPYEQPIAIEGIAVSAGPGSTVPQDLDYTVPRKVKGSRYLWEAPVVGDCMADEIKPGEVVIYSTRLSAEIGKIMVALRDEEELIIKRLRLDGERQVLRPNHGKDVPVDERIRFLGRGVSVQRPLL